MAEVSEESSPTSTIGYSASTEFITITTDLVPIAADSVHQQSEYLTDNQPLPTLLQKQPEAPTSPQQQPQARYVYPVRDLLEGDRKEYIRTCVPLYEASIKGDWGAAFNILQDHDYMVRNSITENWETPLHIAATAHSAKFMKNLVDMMHEDEMKFQNKQGNTALSLAAEAGHVKLAKIMVEKSRELMTIRGSLNMMPIHLAALFGKRDMVIYLYDESDQMSGDDWTYQDKEWIFLQCVEVDIFDLALRILEDHEDMMLFKDEVLRSLLQVLGRKPFAFYDIKPHAIWSIIHSITRVKMGHAIKKSDATLLLRKIWKQIAEFPKKEIYEILRGPMVEVDKNNTYPSRILFIAAELGNTQFLIELIRLYPDLIWKKDDSRRTIFHIAVSYRHESIYNLLYEIGSMKDMITPLTDNQGNNMLHLVGMLAEKDPLEDVSGAAFQMQRELLWYKEVEAMLPPSHRKQKNKAGQTPHELFIKNHKELVTQGEKWMKGTANQSMVVAALITTVVFAAAFTIPGGYDQNSGLPIFLRNGPFIVFVILDAISLILASVSILMFLSILTSRYARDDFLESLPKKLLIGLTTLFLSIITMMVAFSVSFFVLYHHQYISIPIVISVIAIIPAILYAKLQYPLLMDVYRATYSSKYLFKPKKGILYYRSPSF